MIDERAREELRAQDARERARQQQVVVNAFHRVFKSTDGAIILAFLDGHFGTDKPAFLPKPDGGYDPLHAAIRDGQRSIKLQIEHILTLPCIGDANTQPKTKVIRE